MTTQTRRLHEREPAYMRYAFLNPYNLSLFVGGVVAGFLTGHTWLVVITCAAEMMWMIFAPDSKFLHAVWFDRAFARERDLDRRDAREAKLGRVSFEDRTRILRLAEQKARIEYLAKENPSLTVDLLGSELAKLEALLDDFADLAIVAYRAEEHAHTFDFEGLRRTWHVHESQARGLPIGDPRREVAEKNLEVLRQRRGRYDALVRQIQVTRGQMELMEQTFRLLADEIMTIASPSELGVRIDELRVAVEAVRETTSEWEEIGEEKVHERHR